MIDVSTCWSILEFGLGPGKLGVKGVNFLRNCLFRSVTLPLPSILTRYLLNPRCSRTIPDLSHFLAIFPAPCWFWIRTRDPGDSGGKSLVCSDHLSHPFMILFLMASSLFSLLSIQTSEGEKSAGRTGRKSLMGRPYTIWAGLMPYSESGVFLCCSRALEILSRSGDPSDLLLSSTILLADLTADSARKLLFGKYEELVLCSIPHDFRKFWNSLDWNCGPESLAKCSAIPNVVK